MKLRVLAFVNHVPIDKDPTEAIDRAMNWGVDYVIAQGTGKDWGPHWLGSGSQLPVSNFVANIRPYMKLCHAANIPFVLSVGIAGARPQLTECIKGFNELCLEEDLHFNIAVVPGDVDQKYLLGRIEEGAQIRRMDDHPALSEFLTTEDVTASTYVVAQVGPEPIMSAISQGAQGVITGRALDVGLFMAPAILAGASKATAALFGKLLECGGVALDPGDSRMPIYGEIHDDDSIIVRSPSLDGRVISRTLAAHSFYERANPFKEENPGGYLDLTDAVFEQQDGAVKVTGATWVDTPYTVKIEGAAPNGFRAINVAGIREPQYIECIESVVRRIKDEVRSNSRFSHLDDDKYHLNLTLYGRDAVLGEADPQRGSEHEVGVVIDAVAPSQEDARNLCYFASISLNNGGYPGRKTTAGNAAQRFTEMVNPLGQIYRWSIWHLLPLDDPIELFTPIMIEIPQRPEELTW